MPERVVFIRGPFDGSATEITSTPEFVHVAGSRYHRIDDPDTGEYLGGYAYVGPVPGSHFQRPASGQLLGPLRATLRPRGEERREGRSTHEGKQ